MARAGDVLVGRFRLDRQASSGGMGAVWAATDLATGAPVAVKTLAGSDPDDAERFAREARVLAELQHPAIVGYVADGTTEAGERYLAMEWLEGESLARRLMREPITIGESAYLAHRIAGALAIAHQRGVVHRDVKPLNVVLPGGSVESAKLVDFGIARGGEQGVQVTRAGVQVGTPPYMPPERVRGGATVDTRGDVYALGCMLFECLTGRLPYVAEREATLLMRVVFEPVPRPRDLNPAVDPALDELVCAMLAKDPDARPRDGWALVAAFDTLWPVGNAGARPPPLRATRAAPAAQAAGPAFVATMAAAPNAASQMSSEGSTVPLGGGEGLSRLLLGMLEPFGGRVEALVDGSIVGVFEGDATPAESAARAARAALAIRKSLPDCPVGVGGAFGAAIDGKVVGAALESAARGLRTSSLDRAAHVHDAVAALLDARFETVNDGRSTRLVAYRPPRPSRR